MMVNGRITSSMEKEPILNKTILHIKEVSSMENIMEMGLWSI